MKILIDARLYGLENTGIGRYVMNLVDNLVRTDDKTEYIFLLKKRYFSQLNYKNSLTTVLADISEYSIGEQIALPRLISSFSPDLVHFPNFNVPLLYGGKYVVTLHDLSMHHQGGSKTTTKPAPVYFTKRVAYRKVFKHAVVGARKIIVPSEVVKTQVAQYYKIDKNKIEVIYEGVDRMPKVSAKPEEILSKYGLAGDFFIYTGNVYPHKNLERTISAIVRLNQHSRVDFAIVCARSIFTERLEKTIYELGAKDYIKLLGFVDDAELSVLEQKAVGFVFPSLSEGFGLPGLEAIANGTIALVSEIPVFKEIYKDNVLHFNPYRIESMVEVMQNSLRMKEEKRLMLIEKGQKFIQRYSWDKMVRETLSVYKELTDASAPD